MVACLSSPNPPGADELSAHCKQSIASFKRPKHYLFFDALPKSSYGKILRRELRDTVSIEDTQR